MGKMNISTKQLMIDKTNSTMLLIIVATSFVVVFSLVSSKALLEQRSFQGRVITAKEKARNQLNENERAVTELTAAYQNFVSPPENVLGGNPRGNGEKDGDNAQLTLDALPSKYDFPAMTASVEKIILSKNLNIDGFTGVDDEVQQALTELTPAPLPVEIPFEVSMTGNYTGVREVTDMFERSIRPFQVVSLNISGSDQELTLKVNGKSYYQPEKGLNIRTEAVQ